ncbi:MAG: hypothetical protein LC785_03080 [Acidobacteria bacterium]|nr:hypothetical protein [Acidobacteriota bacterium]MCA1640967.1 hypothetical protein [Acidobacteriota bacterium]
MAAKKTGGIAKVTLDAATADKLASSLRRGLAGSAAYAVYGVEGKRPKAGAVELDPRRVASFVKHVHDRLCAAGSISEQERDKMAPKAKGGARKASGGAKRGAKKSR